MGIYGAWDKEIKLFVARNMDFRRSERGKLTCCLWINLQLITIDSFGIINLTLNNRAGKRSHQNKVQRDSNVFLLIR